MASTTIKFVVVAVLLLASIGQIDLVRIQNGIYKNQDFENVVKLESDHCDEDICYIPVDTTGTVFYYRIYYNSESNAVLVKQIITITDSENYYRYGSDFVGKFDTSQSLCVTDKFFISPIAFERFGCHKMVDVMHSYYAQNSDHLASVHYRGFLYNDTECSANYTMLQVKKIDQLIGNIQSLSLTAADVFDRFLNYKLDWLRMLRDKFYENRNQTYPYRCKESFELRSLLGTFQQSSIDDIEKISDQIKEFKSLSPIEVWFENIIADWKKESEYLNEKGRQLDRNWIERNIQELQTMYRLLKSAKTDDKETIGSIIESILLLIESRRSLIQ